MLDNISNGIIDRWADEALDDLGKKSWRELEPNAMMLIIYRIQEARNKKLVNRVSKPFWWLVGIVSSGVVWTVVCSLAERTWN